MTRKVVGWVGAILVLCISPMVVEGLGWTTPDQRGAVVLVGLLVLVVGLLGAELGRSAARPQLRKSMPESSTDRQAWTHARPADGVIEWVRPVDVELSPNSEDDRLTRFEGYKGELSASSEPTNFWEGNSQSPPLLGRVLIVPAFLGRDGMAWSDREIARAYQMMDKAARWIEKEAICWDAAANLALSSLYIEAIDDQGEDDEVELALFRRGGDDVPDEVDADVKTMASFSRAAASFGLSDAFQLIRGFRARQQADTHVWILHVRRTGTSFALDQWTTGDPGTRIAVCFARESTIPERLIGPPTSDPVTFVHELLHLFGATDKYNQPLSSFPSGTVSEHDVMRLDHESLSRLRVDPATAREIGWAQPGQAAPERKTPRARP